MLKVDKGIPAPERVSYGSLASFLRKMQIGDSVFIPHATTSSARSAAVYALGSGNYTTRKEHGGVRVWRTK